MSCGLPGSHCKDNTTRGKNKLGGAWIRFGIAIGNRDRSVEKKTGRRILSIPRPATPADSLSNVVFLSFSGEGISPFWGFTAFAVSVLNCLQAHTALVCGGERYRDLEYVSLLLVSGH